MEENTKKIIIISAIVVALLTIGAILYVTKFRNEDDGKRGNDPKQEQVDNYVEDRLLNLDEVVKKDKSLVQSALKHVPYQNGLYQTIYGTGTVRLENVMKELLFIMGYNEGVNKIEKNTEEYNKLKNDNGIELVDFFVKTDDILKNVKKLYDVTLTDLPEEIQLIGGTATKYGDYYGFVFASEGFGYVKIGKVLSYTSSDNSLVIYEKAAFVDYDFEERKVYVYSDDKGENLVLTIDNEDSSTSDNVLKEIKNNLSSFNTYEHVFKKDGSNYYWQSTGTTVESK